MERQQEEGRDKNRKQKKMHGHFRMLIKKDFMDSKSNHSKK